MMSLHLFCSSDEVKMIRTHLGEYLLALAQVSPTCILEVSVHCSNEYG